MENRELAVARGAGTPRPASGAGGGWSVALLCLVLLAGLAGWTLPARAQASYDPYAPHAGQGYNGAPNGGGSSNNGSGSGSGQQGGGAGQTAPQTTGSSDAFNPTYIPNSSARNGADFADQRQHGIPDATIGSLTPPPPSEFEKFVAQRVGRPLQRFGASLVLDRARGFTTSPTATVPPDYRLNPGDELLIGVTGSVEADLRVVIDSEGRIFIPKIGAVDVAGIRYGDLTAALSRRFAEQYKQARVSVVIGHLHGLNIYVTGYAVSPGAYTVSSLSTMVDAVLAAGGPASGGSFRSIDLRRNGQLITTLDLYDLLLNGDKTRDATLQNEDVINIEPTGPQLAITGSVNDEAIFEAKPGETLGDMIRYAGGLDSLADGSRVLVARLGDLDTGGSQQMTFAAAQRFPAEGGDIVRVLSLANVARPQERQAILATIEGEVDRPGRYYLQPGSTLSDLLTRAGGMTSGAFVFGTNVERQSIRQQQQASFDKAIENLQLTAAALPLSASVFSGGTAAATARSQGALGIIDRLKSQKPDGRLILELAPDAVALPGQVALENNDRIFIPPRPKTVGVFGAVYEAGSFFFRPGSRISDYLRLAGGPEKIADRGDVFVVRANGSVLSNREVHNLGARLALPGDVVFVPVKASASVLDKILTAAAVLSQLSVTALTLTALGL